MQIEDLLEKRERAIYFLVQRLRSSRSSLPLKELSQDLQLSRATLIRYIESFVAETHDEHLGVSLKVQEEEVVYTRSNQLVYENWLAHLCQFSTKYQILLYIFDREEFSIQALAQHLLMSEASLNRQLAALNHLLQDFQISIRNGRLKGSELQIRYFYYQLFLHTKVLNEVTHHSLFVPAFRFLPLFERFYDSHFNSFQALQLALWLGISQRRGRLQEVDFRETIQLMTPYMEQKWYKELRQFSLTLYQYQPSTMREGEVMSLFAFLFSQSILAPQKLERMLAFGGPIREATTWSYHTIRQELGQHFPIDEKILYYLNQLLGSLYFFKGCLKEQVWTTKQEEYVARASDFLSEVLEQFYQPQFPTVAFQSKEKVYPLASLFSYLNQVRPVLVRIGFLSYQSPILAEPILFQLQKEFERKYAVTIEPFMEDKVYDLVISEGQECLAPSVYYLHQGLYEQDLITLKKMIQAIQLEKEKVAGSRLEEPSFPIDSR
ncbi:DNA-binding protein [Streptococcus sp. zg-86]|uniref:DNA-binding protein n=1 Tax=Streptococcus zhangguiae TaxID=2664091 RepID=A0A6I4RHG4_9STRE|nr:MULTISPECIES: helix-turn-helix domain-containing protein [unclassified Streptococcus]MTB63912.1 DNA-binding protein [Streptococcus sp. zg-86]MTB90223.1 DNA-binding protein [Streptococcus sp. zg-36]MWV55893.1 DNA-binding protein [Streptococcus sp. zg-70]QTH46944.1 helix-turn-helix domain-containing protein [Streptococcus sp. zg-86]